jgi:hypothetical protein
VAVQAKCRAHCLTDNSVSEADPIPMADYITLLEEERRGKRSEQKERTGKGRGGEGREE